MKRRNSRRNVMGSSVRPKRRNLESLDRISVLPDSILGIILSFLPTKNAVATSLLSKRWKLVWTMVHNLDFDRSEKYDEYFYYENRHDEKDVEKDMRFAGFVNRVLRHYDAGWLNKFRLVWTRRCIASHASSWINTAISKNVHELTLWLETCNCYRCKISDYYTFVMPTSVFSCDTLRILDLYGGISVSESIAVCLPKLEKLMLGSIYFQSEQAFEKLIRGCPVLISLRISMPDMLIEFYENAGFTYRISSNSLRCLEVDIEYPEAMPLYLNMELEAPSLQYLLLDGFIPVFQMKKSLSSLVEAKLGAELGEGSFSDVNMCNSVVKAVRVFDCAKALILSVHIISALSCATICLSTEFKRLVKLEATTYSCACSSIQDFIECSDNLEVLMVDEVDACYEIEDGLLKWTAPVHVPRCLSNSLKKIVIKGYYDTEDEREMVRYMLKHGNALEDMEVSFDIYLKDHDRSKLELVREICEYSKKLSSKLPACEVKFVGETSKCNFKVL